MSAPSIGAITLFVTDVAVAKAWYQQAFDVSVIFEDEHSSVVQFGNTVVNLLVRSEAAELIAPAAVGAPGAGAVLQFSIWTDDVAAEVVTLAERGVALLNGPVDRPWGMRTACIVDPDGTIWELAQNLSQHPA